MALFDRRAVKSAAGDSLASAPKDPKRLILIHTGATLLLAIVLTFLDYLLEQKIGTTGGLAGIGTRSVLTTVQSVLRYAQILVLPVWNCGYLYACLQLSRREAADEHSLLSGFRRFGPIFRLTLLQAAIYLFIGFVCVYISASVFVMTPWAQELMTTLEPMMETGEISQEALLAAMESVYLPLILIFLAIFLLVSLPIYYRLRMANFSIMDGQRKGAFAAILDSFRLTRHNCIALLKLDFSFWWFYVLDLLVSLLCYGDMILTAFGVDLPWSADASYFIFLFVYAAGQLLLYSWKKNEVTVTYAHVYNTLKPTALDTPAPQPTNPPWQY